jgi:hypothetical protein
MTATMGKEKEIEARRRLHVGPGGESVSDHQARVYRRKIAKSTGL